MKIESLIRRALGTKVELDNVLYHFKPEGEDPRHVADVKRDEHIRIFLGIPEGYRPLEGEKVSDKLQKQIDEDTSLKGSDVHAAVYDIHGEKVDLDSLVLMSFDDSGLTREEWNELDDQKRYVYLDKTLASLRGDSKDPIEQVPEDTPMTGEGYPSPEESGTATTELKATTAKQLEEAEKAKGGDGEKKPEEKPEEKPEALDRDALVAQYKEKFGRKPHHSLSAERIKQAIDQDDD